MGMKQKSVPGKRSVLLQLQPGTFSIPDEKDLNAHLRRPAQSESLLQSPVHSLHCRPAKLLVHGLPMYSTSNEQTLQAFLQ